MTTESTASSGGIGFAGLLALLFITLKLTHVIAWSWWWVLAPLWAPTVVFVGALLFIIAATITKAAWRRRY